MEPQPFSSRTFAAPASLLAVPSLPSQLSSRLKSVGCRNVLLRLSTPLSPSFPSSRAPPAAEARVRWAWTPRPVSPRPSWLHPLAAILSPGPAFPGKFLRRLPPTRLEGVLLGGGFGTGLCFAEGGMRNGGGAGECAGSSASSQHHSVCSSYFYPQGQQLYLSRMPQEPKVFGATSVLQKNTIWMSFIESTFSTPYSPSPGAFAASSALPCSSLCPTISTVVMLSSCPCPWRGG